MKQVLIKKGKANLESVPSPQIAEGYILVRVHYSCISVGTEMAGIKTTAMPLWKRAMNQPENVKKVLETVSSLGVQKTIKLVQGQLEAGNVTGYSAAGQVIGLGENVTDFEIGDLVACAGAQAAHHAEIINVPKNLVVKIPKDVEISDASSVTLGAIALQGIRRANPTIGETFVVVGLGILGQLTTQMLKANGCTVIGLDLDSSRISVGEKAGMDMFVDPADLNKHHQIYRLTSGFGADGIIITAASTSSEIISSAFAMCRKKGRVVIVGDVGLDLKRSDFYTKELDIYISCSYGPGRYDENYENKGIDYPYSYVRWTENRNMQAYLNMLKSKQINLKILNPHIYELEEVTKAYEDLNSLQTKPLLSFLKYDIEKKDLDDTILGSLSLIKHNKNLINIGLIGAGGFAKGMHLPNLQNLSNQFQLYGVVSKTGYNAMSTAKRYGAPIASTDINTLISNPEINAVIISTRHNLHAELALKSLNAGKHVLLEKPMALNKSELRQFIDFYNTENENLPSLTVGFNRRFSKYSTYIKSQTEKRSNPMIINYRMNAGYIPLDHWVHSDEGGGRNIGEACHIYDLFTYFTNSRFTSVKASSIKPTSIHYSKFDNFVATITFEDGSIGNLIYTALGDRKFPKEQMEIYVDGKIFSVDDYKKIDCFGVSGKKINSSIPEKGQLNELKFWGESISKGQWTIPFWQQVQATEISFEIQNQLMEQ